MPLGSVARDRKGSRAEDGRTSDVAKKAVEGVTADVRGDFLSYKPDDFKQRPARRRRI